MLITIDHPDLSNAEETLLTSPSPSGSTSLSVKDTQGFSTNVYVAVGQVGVEKTEIVLMSANTSTTMTVGATSYSHSEGDPVTYMRYNQARIYKASSLTGTYTLLATVSLDVDNPDLETVYDDTTGTSTDYYKISYYNDVSTLESSLSDPIPGSGVATNTVRYVTDQILREAKDEGQSLVSRDEIIDWMNEVNADVVARRRKWSWLAARTTATTISGQNYYQIGSDNDFATSDNIMRIYDLAINYNNGTDDLLYRLRYIPKDEFDSLAENQDQDNDDTLKYYTYDEALDYIRVYPKPSTGADTMYLYYYKDLPTLDSDGDTLDAPEVRIYKYYCLQQFYVKKGEVGIADRYGVKYEQAINNLERREAKQVGQPKGFTYRPSNYRQYLKY